MPNYRRAMEGNTFFFTVVTYQRKPILCHEKSRLLLRKIIRDVRQLYPFSAEAWVLLPDHMHCLWQLPEGDKDYSLRWGLIKKNFTKEAKIWLKTPEAINSRKKHREGTVWQRRFWEHMIRDEQDFSAHADYIHYNPVKHGLSKAPMDWTYSSFHRFVREGLYPKDWGAAPIELSQDVGSE